MKRLIAGTLATVLVGSVGGLGISAATGDPGIPWMPVPPSAIGDDANAKVVYALGGARAPGIPWHDYTNQAGSEYFPNPKRDLIDYPAGAPFSWVPELLFPGRRDNVTVGHTARQATNSLYQAIRHGTEPGAAVGLSQGTLALDQEQLPLANDPKAPPRNKLQFTTIGDPMGTQAFGASFLSGIFKPGDYIP